MGAELRAEHALHEVTAIGPRAARRAEEVDLPEPDIRQPDAQ